MSFLARFNAAVELEHSDLPGHRRDPDWDKALVCYRLKVQVCSMLTKHSAWRYRKVQDVRAPV